MPRYVIEAGRNGGGIEADGAYAVDVGLELTFLGIGHERVELFHDSRLAAAGRINIHADGVQSGGPEVLEVYVIEREPGYDGQYQEVAV